MGRCWCCCCPLFLLFLLFLFLWADALLISASVRSVTRSSTRMLRRFAMLCVWSVADACPSWTVTHRANLVKKKTFSALTEPTWRWFYFGRVPPCQMGSSCRQRRLLLEAVSRSLRSIEFDFCQEYFCWIFIKSRVVEFCSAPGGSLSRGNPFLDLFASLNPWYDNKLDNYVNYFDIGIRMPIWRSINYCPTPRFISLIIIIYLGGKLII